MVVSMVVCPMVVEGAEQDEVGEVGAPTQRPGHAAVMGFAPGGRDVAADGSAGALLQLRRLALPGLEEPVRAADVEWL